MIWKPLLAPIFILFSIQNTYAHKTITYEPIVKYNYSKSHYLVSLPVNKDSRNGFTAVFDSKTQQLKFKVPTYFFSGLVFLSDDGNKLIQIDSNKDSLDKHLTLFFRLYDQNGKSRSITFFDEKEESHLWDGIRDVRQEKNQLIVITKDSSYVLSEDNLKVNKIKNVAIGGYFENISKSFLDNDSVFSISRLTINEVSIIVRLLADLNMQQFTRDIGSKDKPAYILRFKNCLSTSNKTFRTDEFSLRNIHYKTEDKHKTSLLKMRISELLDSYISSADIIPSGVDFWYFTGHFSIVEN